MLGLPQLIPRHQRKQKPCDRLAPLCTALVAAGDSWPALSNSTRPTMPPASRTASLLGGEFWQRLRMAPTTFGMAFHAAPVCKSCTSSLPEKGDRSDQSEEGAVLAVPAVPCRRGKPRQGGAGAGGYHQKEGRALARRKEMAARLGSLAGWGDGFEVQTMGRTARRRPHGWRPGWPGCCTQGSTARRR